MNEPHRFIIHGSVHGITDEITDHFRRFERAGGHVEILRGACDGVVSYDGDGDPVTIESLIHILEQAGSCAESAHGVITFGFEDREPSHLHVGVAKAKAGHPFWSALTSIHLRDWMAKKLQRGTNRG
ncbi:hypothetical protein [Acidithiobacillus ferrooxidans]|uniref:hypothetical protein n=1 Tax=Acidithiobacillus ferrooxidans TaxID=920 RepID=UPI000AFA1283|nr:hypothetical protein [Acidithiobacillus ferrooxidans]